MHGDIICRNNRYRCEEALRLKSLFVFWVLDIFIFKLGTTHFRHVVIPCDYDNMITGWNYSLDKSLFTEKGLAVITMDSDLTP